MRRRETVACRICGEGYDRLAQGRPPGRCPSCMHPSGPDHPQWRGGEYFNETLNRWMVTTPDGRTLYRYRWVMEQELGRPLRPDEHIHHINGDSTDDRPENLQIVSGSEHIREFHANGGEHTRSRMKFAWSTDHPECVECGTTEREHVGHGKCSRCYFRERARINRAKAAA